MRDIKNESEKTLRMLSWTRRYSPKDSDACCIGLEDIIRTHSVEPSWQNFPDATDYYHDWLKTHETTKDTE